MNGPPSHDVTGLAAAFELFNTTAAELRAAYEGLQNRVEQLDRELDKKNRELASQISEVNRVKDYLNDLMGSITDGVIATDLDGRITALNAAGQRITGFSATDLLGKQYRPIFSDDIELALAQPDVRPSPGEYAPGEIVTRSGKRIPVGQSIALVHDATGSVTGAVKVFHDLTEISMLREQVRRKDRLAAVGEMAATVAHEIRNPLGGIEGFAALLARDFDDDDPRRRLVDKIVGGAKSLDRVVTDLLEFTRPLDLRFRQCDCRAVLDNSLSYARPQIAEHDITVERRYPDDKVCAAVDSDALGRVLLNLMLNAVHSMESGGTLSVALERKSAGRAETENRSSMTRIEVADTGCGIKPETISKVFDPFFTTREKGTGLGLAIAHRIVEAHNGSISLDSEVGKGTTVRIDIPLVNTGGTSET